MSARIKYSDEPMEAKVVPDFLPPPDQLQLQDETVEVTLTLSKQSVEFFKAEAAHKHTQYQRLMRQLIEQSVAAKAHPKRSSLRYSFRRICPPTTDW
jgi:hypothetical protein